MLCKFFPLSKCLSFPRIPTHLFQMHDRHTHEHPLVRNHPKLCSYTSNIVKYSFGCVTQTPALSHTYKVSAKLTLYLTQTSRHIFCTCHRWMHLFQVCDRHTHTHEHPHVCNHAKTLQLHVYLKLPQTVLCPCHPDTCTLSLLQSIH